MTSLNTQLRDSVQQRPAARTGQGATLRLYGATYRGALLKPRGSRERERQLYFYYYHDYNTLFRGAVAGAVKRLQSTPWQVEGGDEDYFQDVLLTADFGSWDRFLSKLVTNFLVFDGGAFVELIAPGDPLEPIRSRVTGLAVLDSLRCYPTGDPDYPVIYYDDRGQMHLMHHTRVVQIVDMPNTTEYEYDYGYGDSALSRCITPVYREILMARYVQQFLDDNPPPGFALAKNLNEDDVNVALDKHRDRQRTDAGDTWGKTAWIYGMQTEVMPEIEFITFNQSPEKFDFQTYKDINVNEIALGLGVDKQELWELTGSGNLGTSTQSEILHRKSRGKLMGYLMRAIERLINQAFPAETNFGFKFSDAEEDRERAETALAWANTIAVIGETLTPEERRKLLVLHVEAVADAVGQAAQDDDERRDDVDIVPTNDLDSGADKEINVTRAEFKSRFVELVSAVQSGLLQPAALRLALRAELAQKGTQAFRDGLQDGGAAPELTDAGRRIISAWRGEQTRFVNNFVRELTDTGVSDVRDRADMWVNMSINKAYYEGLAEADREARYMWVVDPLKEHCVTCLRLNGQVHRMKEYTKRGLLPQSRALVCGGWQCGCRLIKTDQPARGRFRSVRYVRGRREHRHKAA